MFLKTIFSSLGVGHQSVSHTRLPIILLHGAWYTPVCWDLVKPFLEQNGHKVYTPFFPYYDDDPRSKEITRKEFIEGAVIREIRRAQRENDNQKPILLGHSLAGTIIAETAEAYPDEISGLVFLAGFMLPNAISIKDIRLIRNHKKVNKKEVKIGAKIYQAEVILRNGKKVNAARLDKESAIETFCQDCTREGKEVVRNQMKWVMPSQPIQEKVRLGENYEKVARFYIKTLKDKAVFIKEQEAMINASSCFKVYEIDSGHSPFINKPKELADCLISINKELTLGNKKIRQFHLSDQKKSFPSTSSKGESLKKNSSNNSGYFLDNLNY